jgi:hypothetical protein
VVVVSAILLENHMSNELQTNSEGGGQTLAPPSQIEQFKSLYYLLKGKRDTEIKLFHDFKTFRHSDIIELNEKIYRKLQLHTLVTDNLGVVVSLSNKEIKSFGNWNEFRQYDWNISATTNYVTLEWDFNILLPNQTHSVPQTHTLRVRIGQTLRPHEMIQVIFQGGDETEVEEAHAQMVCKIDFVNSQICSELKTIVSDWYDALPNNSDDNKLIKFILRHKVKIQQSIVILFLLAGIIVLNFITHYLISKIPNVATNDLLKKFYLISTCSFVVIYGFYIAGTLYADRVLEKRIRKFRRNPMFEFTKGDNGKIGEIGKKNKSLISKLGWDLLVAIGINVVAYLIGTILPTIAEMIK